MSAGLSLERLQASLPGGGTLQGDGAVQVLDVRQDSRQVQAGDLFVARRGEHADGARYVQSAIERGAVAVLAERGGVQAPGVPVLWVDDVTSALAHAAAVVHGDPSASLEVVGITGTNGKTTTTHLLREALDGLAGAPRCATLGTVGHRFGDQVLPSTHTTPEADELQRILATWKVRGARTVAMEVSSHALTLGRVLGVHFRVAAFTNLSHDHLDFHGSMAEYGAAKARLFLEHAPAAAVINVGDAFGAELARSVRAPLLRVAAREGIAADVVARDVRMSLQGTRFSVHTPHGVAEIASRLVGLHNVENLLTTLGVLLQLEVPFAQAVAAVEGSEGAAGRLERCDLPSDDVLVAVDYAHTPDALARVLQALQQGKLTPEARILCVFGCGGDRDAAKRAPMGQVAAQHASVSIITNDNPRSEDPATIARAIEEGVRAEGVPAIDAAALSEASRGYRIELDRARAIELAVLAARPGDLVLIAGKGHEDYQIVGARKYDFDDRAHARAALALRRGRSPG